MTLAVRVPEELSARVPAEQRGPGRGRDSVRLLVSRGVEVSHHAFVELPRLLRAGDLLVVNTSPTLAAAVDGRIGHACVVVHFSTRGDDGRWAVELRDPVGDGTTRARAGGPVGTEVRLPGGVRLTLTEPLGADSDRLWWARVSGAEAPGAGAGAGAGAPRAGEPGPDTPEATVPRAGAPRAKGQGAGAPRAAVPGPHAPMAGGPEATVLGAGVLREYGRPIRYSYTERDQPLSVYQTVFALPTADGAGSAEMPSAARPFTASLVAELVSRGVQFAPITLHTGVASAEAHEAPYPERFSVPEASARLINAARAGDGRVVAVGTTAVRAVESAAGEDGVVRARAGWTDLVVTPERGVRVVDGLLTGLHEPEASHLLMLEAIAGRAAIGRSYEEALRGLYLWHEFGDVHLILPEENPHSVHCSSN
ncbi:S-adenosylmethionine:tRNA ribosyltransferase-isomerase [Streptomyces pseudovenezuelae]|uniref:S-adenosylmethionine:tRNA ribosyltransferase-isomerase n=1 Tax=Streptomyces pseudovenezuelae TaxID=67350 RepID=A0ABT6LI86_9ACTN|nr:S-adenosylmethionine:tRNA ribosyltransferase-isomerase [Streptomyces pseudovenezuelae]MDH6216008.1 S-adenosylmethionine:tRNA ribosyltransferase-isomerase [Streptomyces pseudovenezuelae]